MFVKFFYQPTIIGKGEDGLPSYGDEVFVEIHVDSTNVYVGKASDDHKKRFKEMHQAFLESNVKSAVVGYPLDMWPRLTPASVMNLKMRGITTVQQLSEVDPKTVPPSVAEDVAAAKQFLQYAKGGVLDMDAINKLKLQVESLTEENRDLRAKVSNLLAMKEKADAA